MMKFWKFILVAFFATSPATNAEIFKCKVNGKTAYQAAPCDDEKTESTLDKVKMVNALENEIAERKRMLKQEEYNRERLAKAKIAAELAAANQRNAAAESSRAWAETSARQADSAEERDAAMARESAARERFYNRNTPGYRYHPTQDR